ncbi:MAG: hypothetical protein GX333_05850 [Syntrophomonadaceae bacterium]|nr:hypothetical protein [Syntrophomonadaceae bacterium]
MQMRNIRLWLFFIIFILLLAYIIISNRAIFSNPNNIGKIYFNNFLAGDIGYGIEGKYGNNISWEDLEVGDILLGGYPNCSYGRFSHAGVYMGNNLVVEGFGDLGITIQPIYHYLEYSEIALLKVNTSMEIKEKAVEYMVAQAGGLFYPVAFKPGERIWNCSKIIWLAYYNLGIDLDFTDDIWIAPDIFYDSPYTTVIREKSYENS